MDTEVHSALQLLLAAKQTKEHFRHQFVNENNRKLKNHQLSVLKRLFEQFPDEVRLLAKEEYDALQPKAADAPQPNAGRITL